MCAAQIPPGGSKDGLLKLKFLGTRGEIEVHSRRHQRHSALLIEHNNARIMIDCRADRLGWLSAVEPTAIMLTMPTSIMPEGLPKAPNARSTLLARRRAC